MRKPPVTIYEVYPGPRGWTAASREYRGHRALVAATSLAQALHFAANQIWASNVERPVGLLYRYQRGAASEHLLWCGCEAVANLHHGNGILRIREVMQAHVCQGGERR